MENLDPAQEWQQLQETYGLMTEDELCTVAQDAYDLTPTAREALQAIIRERGLKIELKAEALRRPSLITAKIQVLKPSNGWRPWMRQSR